MSNGRDWMGEWLTMLFILKFKHLEICSYVTYAYGCAFQSHNYPIHSKLSLSTILISCSYILGDDQ